jgi:hypothetical protein
MEEAEKKRILEKEKGQDETCPICLGEDLKNDFKVLPCKHKFHKICMHNWSLAESQRLVGGDQTSCPLCRSTFAKNIINSRTREESISEIKQNLTKGVHYPYIDCRDCCHFKVCLFDFFCLFPIFIAKFGIWIPLGCCGFFCCDCCNPRPTGDECKETCRCFDECFDNYPFVIQVKDLRTVFISTTKASFINESGRYIELS